MQSSRQGVTQKQIAERLGINQMTVSRVLSGRGRVGPETRERVLATADALGYRPNIAAKRVKAGGQYLAVSYLHSIASTSYNMLFPETLNALCLALANSGYQLSMANINHTRFNEPGYVSSLVTSTMADGFVMSYVGNDIDAIMLKTLAKYQIPMIWANSKKEMDCVYFDDYQAAADLTTRLIQSERRRIAFFNLERNIEISKDFYHYSNYDRYQGYRDTMEAAGLKAIGFFKHAPDPSREEMMKLIYDGLKNEKVDAAICYSDLDLNLLTVAALKTGIDLGTELLPGVFSNSRFGWHDFSLIQIRLPVVELGQRCAALILEKLTSERMAAMPPIVLPLSDCTTWK